MRALDRKLVRDLWHYRGQLGAIIAVVACGIALFVTLRSMNGFLRGSRDDFYASYRFADIFARLKRAPEHVARAVAALPGVDAVATRVVEDVTLDVPGLAEPAVGRLVSVPVPRAAALNDVHLRGGRWPLSDRPGEIVASAAFARANDLLPGDSIGAVLHGRWRWLHIVGIGISPEYVYELGEGSIFPDNRRFGVLWIGRDELADAFGMHGAFNDLAVTLRPDGPPGEVISSLDRLLAPYGAFGAIPRADQLSHQFLDGEIEETQVTSVLLPGIFLAVTAFLLHIVLSRLVGTQRDQIATLRAYGYGIIAVGTHYLLLALVPIGIGSILGSVLGLWFAGGLADVYARFFQFPAASFTPDPGVLAMAVIIGGGAGLAGALGSVLRSARLAPAVAMRPEAPARFRPGILERIPAARRLSPVVHIVARSLERRPVRTLSAIAALAMAGGLVITVGALFDAIDLMKDMQFHEIAREDVTVVFERLQPPSAVAVAARLPGVLGAEGFRIIPVRVRSTARAWQTALYGLPADGVLHRIVDASYRARRPPTTGLLVSQLLARALRVRVGDHVAVETLDGTGTVRRLEIVGISDDLIGTAAYLELDTMGRVFGERSAVSGTYLAADRRSIDSLYARLKRLPAVSTVAVREVQRRGFEQTIAESFRISLMTTLGFAVVIAFGIVYNSARVSLSERGRELASLRVLGFSKGEVTAMLLGEQGLLTLLSLPLAFATAAGLTWLLVVRFASELYRIPVVMSARTYSLGALTVLLAAVLSALAIRRRIRHLDLIAVLKTRE